MLPLQDRRIELQEIMPNMDVVDLDGERVGVVAHVHPTGDGHDSQAPHLEIATGFFGLGPRLLLPLQTVRDVAHGCVFLREPKDILVQA